MKYFTPERYTALQDFSSDAAMSEAETLWEEAVERYNAYFHSVEQHIPDGIRELQGNYYLHDALVTSMGRQGNHFVIVLRLDTPPRNLLLLEYELAGPPSIDEEAFPAEYRSTERVEWLHDEIELTATTPPGCSQSILLSNGWEVQLPVHDVRVLNLSALIPGNLTKGSPAQLTRKP